MPSEKSAEGRLVGGVLVLMPAALFTKLVGLFYKIPLIAIVGVTGMAYFLAAYHVYSLLFVLSATGLPTALSLLVSRAVARGGHGAARRVLAVALLLFFCPGAAGTACLICFAPAISAHLAMEQAAACMIAVAPSLLLAVFIGAAKGYFQGYHRMLPTAIAEVLEAGGKLGFGLCFALLAKGRGMPTHAVAAAAIFGITAGLLLSALYLAVFLLIDAVRRRGESGELLPARRRVAAELMRVALPVTLSASVMSLVSLIDTALISRRLQAAGFAPAAANAMYSSYGNLAVPLYNLVPSLLGPITLTLMPLLCGALSRGEADAGRSALRSALRLCALLAIPAALGLGVFADPILRLIYAGQSEAVAVAAPLLSLLALSVLPAALVTLTGAALQAAGRTLTPIFAMCAGALVKLGVELVLLPLAGVYMMAAPISTLCCNLTVLTVEAIALSRALPFRFFTGRDLLRPLAAALCSIGAGAAVYLLLRSRWSSPLLMLPVLALSAALYVLTALRLRAVGEAELKALPKGESLCHTLRRLHLLH